MECHACKKDTLTQRGICINIDCKSNKNREFTSLDILEGHIYKGHPPDTIGMEYDNKATMRTVFRWECGTYLYLRYELAIYLITLARFMDFWGTCLPGGELNVKEKKGGK